MSHMCGRALSDNKKILHFFNKQSGATDKNCCLANRSTADCKCPKQCKTDGQHNMKRLKTRKERSQMRGGGKEASKTKLHRHHCHHQTSKTHTHHCYHSSCHCPSLFPNVAPATHEPSIITDNRLTGHHGLFNHEVKSIDIERLLGEQVKLEKGGQSAQEKIHAVLHLSSTTCLPSTLSSNDLLCADTNEVVPFQKKAVLATNMMTHDDCREKDRKSSHGSDITPGQRPQQLNLSSHSYKSIFSSEHSSNSVEIIKSKKTNAIMLENDKASQLTPTAGHTVKTLKKKVKTHITSTLKSTPKNQEPPEYQTQAHGLSPNPLKIYSSLTADSFDIQRRRQDPSCVSTSVSAMAACLCDSLHFPLLRKRNLLSESREVLLKVLRERHGPNFLKEQQRLSFSTDLTKAAQNHNQEPTITDEDASESQTDSASQPCFDTQKSTPFKIMGSSHFNWRTGHQPHQSLDRAAEWLRGPVDVSARFLDDILRPTCSPQFYMNFEPPGASASDHLTFSPTSCWAETASASQHWEDGFNRPMSKESVIFDSCENSFMSCTTAVRERCCRPQHKGGNIQPFFSYQTQLPHRRSAEHMHFPQKQGLFQPDKYSFQTNHFLLPFSQFSHPSTCPPLRSHLTDMAHYPPSHMLERCPAPPLHSLPSPENWSFPPMKLY